MAVDLNQPITAETLAFRSDLEHAELVTGTLRISEPPGGVHGLVAVRLGYRLHAFVEAHSLGVVMVETGFVLRRNPDTVRGPDLSFVRAARIPSTGIPPGFLPLAPDLAIEIRSPSDPAVDLDEKVADYLAAGVRLIWVIDPAARQARINRADGSLGCVDGSGSLDGEDVLPGFRCLLSEIMPPLTTPT